MEIKNPDALQKPLTNGEKVEALAVKARDPTYEHTKEEWMTIVSSAIYRAAKDAIEEGGMNPSEAARYLTEYASFEEPIKEFHQMEASMDEIGNEIGEDGRQFLDDHLRDTAGDDPNLQYGNEIIQGCSMGLRDPRIEFSDIKDHLLYLAVLVNNEQSGG